MEKEGYSDLEITSLRAYVAATFSPIAHWRPVVPGLPAVVVSENFGNKLTRRPRQRA